MKTLPEIQENGWDSGINEIWNGDCLEFMKNIPDKAIHLLLTDPPYGVDLGYDHYEDSEQGWFELMDKWIPEARRIAQMVIFPSCRLNRLDWYYKNHAPDWWVVWDKGSPGIRSPLGFNDYELCAVYGKNNKTPMHDIVRIVPDEAKGNYGHPCPKPINWSKWFIARATQEGEIVLDTFVGSGTSAFAARQLGRKFIGIDVSEQYCRIAEKRLGQGQLF